MYMYVCTCMYMLQSVSFKFIDEKLRYCHFTNAGIKSRGPFSSILRGTMSHNDRVEPLVHSTAEISGDERGVLKQCSRVRKYDVILLPVL